MNLAAFKQRYPLFINNDVVIQLALDDAELLLTPYSIDENNKELAVALMAAHLLTLLPVSGAVEQEVIGVKSSDGSEVRFSDSKGGSNWLRLSSYGQMLALLINPIKRTSAYGVIKDCHPDAIRFDDRIDYDGATINGQQDIINFFNT